MEQQIPQYTLLEKLGEGVQTIVYKGYYKNVPHRLLTIKVIKTALLSDSQKKYFRQKIEHLKVLPDERLMAPLTFHDSKNLQFITRLYFEGLPLNEWIATQTKIKLDDFLTIAISLAELLEKTHQAGIIHGGMKPHNILIDPQTLELRIVDFITPLDVRNVSHFIYDKKFIDGTLAYTSPEQTGRINHRVEFTTDIYSLGVIFYEMLTGKLPFASNDPLELIHSHLAEEAPYVHELNKDIPAMLGLIIDKMLLKQPEKRYQRGKGLSADLMKLRQRLQSANTDQTFNLGLEDRSHRINFISKMVGRDKEAELILSEYNDVANGAFKSLLISGYSGIGKTRLIQELQKPIVKHQGYFTSGKFDVYQKNIPYSSLIQAFRNLTRTFLTESDERVEKWKNKITEAVGNNGRVITDVIPELQVLIGPQPMVLDLPPVEARNRFLDVFNRFLGCLATKESPLVLFIDDLQWCDIASFEFMTNLFKNSHEHPYLFLLGAYRHNEVDPAHPLTKLIKFVKEEKKPLKEVHLGPILDKHSHEMVSYILDSSMEQTEALGMFLAKLTEGNPLFVSESLSYLYNENLLYYNENNGQWSWNMDQIRNSQMPSSVVALFSSKVHKLPQPTIDLLQYCACMGNLFTPDELSLVREISLLDVFETLKPALGQGLLIENKDQMQFVHDKVQEATLAFIDKNRRRSIHWQVGNHLLQNVPEGIEFDKLENIFTITSHLNIASRLAEEAGESISEDFKSLLSKVNYFAGNSALNSLATDAANEYYTISRQTLNPNSWDVDYERTYRVYQKLGKTELMVGRSDSSEKILNELLDNAKSDLDKAEALAEQTTSLSSIGNFIKAIETANRGLAYFGKDIPLDNEVARKRCEELMQKIHADGKDVWKAILNMPFTHERQSKIELAFYSELIPDLYMSGLVNQLYLAAAQSTQNCLSGGMDESVIYSFSIMGLNLGEKHHFQEAFKYEDLAKELSEKYPNTFGATRGMNGVVWCNMHSRNHAQEIIDYCLKSIQSGKNCGDLYNAGLSYGPLMWNMQVQGWRLSEIEGTANECYQFSKKFNLLFSVGLAQAVTAGWVEPMKVGYQPVAMDETIATWQKSNHIASIGSYYVLLGIANYYFGDYEEAHKNLETVNTYLHGLTDNILKRQWFIFRMLTAVKRFEAGTGFTTTDELNNFCAPIMKDVKAWTELGPVLRPLLKFFEAEKMRQEQGMKVALGAYLEAQQVAHEQEYTFLEAHINEVLGGYFKNQKLISYKLYLHEAYRLYEQIEITRKVSDLQDQHPDVFGEEFNRNVDKSSKEHNIAESSIEKAPLMDLDVEYLIKSNLAISAEIDQDRLFKKILNVILESSGAQYGCMVIEKKGDLLITAESQIKNKSEVVTLMHPLEQSKNVSKSIVRYVHRTFENMILNNACEEGIFKDNPEVQELKLKSVFCFPIVKQSKLVGIIYLENRLVPSAFSNKELEMLKLLASQISISIENANLVDEMRSAEKLIKASLQEKEILLKEIHHAKDLALQASKVKSEFLANMSHEVRTPLNGIVGMTDLLLESGLTNDQSRCAGAVLLSAQSLLSIINDILDFSKIESGKMELESLPFNLQTMLEEKMELFKFTAQRKDLYFRYELPDLPYEVYGDSPRLGQILNNLLGNAIKFTPHGGVTFTGEMTEDLGDSIMMKFTVKDTGIGVKEEAMGRLFQAFSQGDRSTARRYGGSGLGLSIAKKLVDLMGGNINLQSMEGVGTVFWFSLNLRKGSLLASQVGKVEKAAQLSPLEGRVLVAEDVVVNQQVCVRMLKKFGCNYQIVSNGKECLDALEHNEYDLILMDCQMPEMDGYQATRIIRSRSDAKFMNIPILALTANALVGDKEKCIEEGMNDFLTKPITQVKLHQALSKYLKSKPVVTGS